MAAIQPARRTGDAVGEFGRYFARAAAICLALLILPSAGRYSNRIPSISGLDHLVWEMRNGDLNAEDFQALAAGYYEGLENKARFELGDWKKDRDDFDERDDFLLYGFKPRVHHAYGEGLRVTNSLGMPNAEYGVEKPAHTRRIALMGDSTSVGPYGHSYELLLEQKLNQCCRTADIQQFQVLNFSVPGYTMLQKMDMALETAKRFHPDVYVMALSFRDMHATIHHIGDLETGGIDLKYAYLKRTAASAGIQRNDRKPSISKKLDPYRMPILRWALEQVLDAAAAQGAKTVIFLVPMPENLTTQKADFAQFDALANSIGVPVLDLGRAYDSASDLRKLQIVPPEDRHPNIRGNEMIYNELSARLAAQPEAMSALAGH